LWCKMILHIKKRDINMYLNIPTELLNNEVELKKKIKEETQLFNPTDVDLYVDDKPVMLEVMK